MRIDKDGRRIERTNNVIGWTAIALAACAFFFVLGIRYEQRQTAAGRVIDRAFVNMANEALRFCSDNNVLSGASDDR